MAMDVVQTKDIRHGTASGFQIASLGITPATCLSNEAKRVARWRFGAILTEGGRLSHIVGRWWPYQGNLLQTIWDIRMRPLQHDRCVLYYSQPLSCPTFLTLNYIRSGPQTTLTTLYAATLALDEIARLKNSNAIVCNATNQRISDRLMERWGWQTHCLDWPGRHFIKRFYGQYPELNPYWRSRLQS